MATNLAKNTDVPLWSKSRGQTDTILKEIVCNYLDTATTSFGRATHYNTREEQQKAELSSHKAMLNFDRDLYALFSVLPGTTDRASQIVTKNLLANPRNGMRSKVLDSEMEAKVIYHLINELPPQRIFKIFAAFKDGDEKQGISKANNARTRKLILKTILGSNKLELWSVKYRNNMKKALTHAWGESKTGIIRTILGKTKWNAKDRSIIEQNLTKYASKKKSTLECIAFVLDSKRPWTLPLIKAFGDAKKNLNKGKQLPIEVLEGIRSTYHPNTPSAKVMELKKDSLTKKQQKNLQATAKKANVKVDFDPMNYEAIELYLYGFERGFTNDIFGALNHKAMSAAEGFPEKFESIGIILDGSKSMYGDQTQPLRPLAAVLAIRDMLVFTSTTAYEVHATSIPTNQELKPCGDTELASHLIDLLKKDVQTIFVLSDGYENAPAGRFGEVLEAARSIGIDTPVYHINPVYAAEVGGVRELAPKLATTLPIQKPSALSTTFIRGMLEQDPVQAVNKLISMTYPKLLNGAR